MSNTRSLKILFFGDLVGKIARNAVANYLDELRQNNNYPDFVIANVENASHGFGLTEKNYNELSKVGIDCFTAGNHIWDKREIFNYIDNADKLVRPINYPANTPGVGSRIFDKGDYKIAVINALGRVFMPPIDSPLEILKAEVERLKEITPYIIIDFHAEATAEKICLGKYLSEIGAIAFFGTHTHVQTADEQIINNMAYITDAGFCGAKDSVIGMEYATSLRRMTTLLPERYEVAVNPPCVINAVEVSIVDETVTAIKRINVNVDMKEKELEVSVETNSV